MNLFAGQEQRHGHRGQIVDTGGEGEGGIKRVALKLTHYRM